MAYKNYAGIWIAACIALIAGCSNAFVNPELREQGGRVLIRLAPAQERTLYPDRALITSYTLIFVHEDGETLPERTLGVNETLQMDLKNGNWMIMATGCAGSGQEKVPVVQGMAHVTVSGEKTAVAEIWVDQIIGKGETAGTFEYTVEFPPALVNAGFLRISSIAGDGACTPYTSADLLKNGEPGRSAGVLTLPAGYYQMDIQLAALYPYTPYIGKTEVVHVYPGLATKTPVYRFETDDFLAPPEFDGAAALGAYLDQLPENTENDPYPVRVRNIDLSSTSAAGNTLRGLYQALSRYVALDLRGCTGSKIPNTAYGSRENIVSIILPETITAVGLKAFADCPVLVSVSLPGVTGIEHSAFKNCVKLEQVEAPRLIEISNSLGDSNSGAFYGCVSLKSIAFNEVIKIAERSFYKCSSLASLSLPKVTSIGNDAFKSCRELKDLALPRIVSIGNSAFAECDSLSAITLGAMPPSLEGDKVFQSKTLKTIYVPSPAVTAYRETAVKGWTDDLKAKVTGLPD